MLSTASATNSCCQQLQLERRNQDYEKINRELHDTNDTHGTQRKARAANAQDLTYHVEVSCCQQLLRLGQCAVAKRVF